MLYVGAGIPFLANLTLSDRSKRPCSGAGSSMAVNPNSFAASIKSWEAVVAIEAVYHSIKSNRWVLNKVLTAEEPFLFPGEENKKRRSPGWVFSDVFCGIQNSDSTNSIVSGSVVYGILLSIGFSHSKMVIVGRIHNKFIFQLRIGPFEVAQDVSPSHILCCNPVDVQFGSLSGSFSQFKHVGVCLSDAP